jgi:hypothetical protein
MREACESLESSRGGQELAEPAQVLEPVDACLEWLVEASSSSSPGTVQTCLGLAEGGLPAVRL